MGSKTDLVRRKVNQMERNIFIVAAIGVGCTPKSAFDDAMFEVGIHNFNLIPLSSVIPPKTNIIETRRYNREVMPGTMQPVVMAHYASDKAGQVISAGIGWKLATEGGVFVEISGPWDGQTTENKLADSVEELARRRRDWNLLQPCQTRIMETTVGDKAACVLVCAVYDFMMVWGKKLDLGAIPQETQQEVLSPRL